MLTASLLLLVSASGALSQTVVDDTLVLRNVTVLPMDRDGIEAAQTVVVAEGRVVTVGPVGDVPLPDAARVIDASGLYLMPGLADAHVHLRDTTELSAYLAHGVTTVFQLSGPQERVADLRGLKEDVASEVRLGPRLLLSGRLIDGDPPIFGDAADIVTTPDQARALVGSRTREGYDFVKVYNNVPREALSVVIQEAHGNGLAVFGHVPRGEGREGALEWALGEGMDVVAHGEEYFFTRFYRGIEDALDAGGVVRTDTAGLSEVVARSRRSGVFVTPNLSFVRQTRLWLDDPEQILDDDEYAFLPPFRREGWQQENPGTRENLARFSRREAAKSRFLDLLTLRLHQGGVPLLAGTDASFAGLYPGASLHLELQELVRVGLTPLEALRTATLNPGRLIQRMRPSEPVFGVISEGARADLLLLSSDPRQDLTALEGIVAVIVAGRWYDMETIQAKRPRWPRSAPP